MFLPPDTIVVDGSLEKPVFFTYYAALVKNLRGVLLLVPGEEGVRDRIEWLKKRFHYRNLGLTPSTDTTRYKDLLEARIFRRLYYPVEEFMDLVGIMVSTGLDRLLAEAIVFSSIYISPLFLLTSKYNGFIEKYSLGVIRTCKDLGVNDWKLHMRIADYTILDSYEDMVDLSLEYIGKIDDREAREKIIGSRREYVEHDMKRYWRIKCGEGRAFLYYLDPLLYIEDKLDYLRDKLVRDYAAGLAVIPVLNLLLAPIG
jgi:hypothetical protein